jgi:hypothetical protein
MPDVNVENPKTGEKYTIEVTGAADPAAHIAKVMPGFKVVADPKPEKPK